MNKLVTAPPFFKKPEFSREENVQADIRMNLHHPVNRKFRRVTAEETHCLFPFRFCRVLARWSLSVGNPVCANFIRVSSSFE